MVKRRGSGVNVVAGVAEGLHCRTCDCSSHIRYGHHRAKATATGSAATALCVMCPCLPARRWRAELARVLHVSTCFSFSFPARVSVTFFAGAGNLAGCQQHRQKGRKVNCIRNGVAKVHLQNERRALLEIGAG